MRAAAAGKPTNSAHRQTALTADCSFFFEKKCHRKCHHFRFKTLRNAVRLIEYISLTNWMKSLILLKFKNVYNKFSHFFYSKFPDAWSYWRQSFAVIPFGRSTLLSTRGIFRPLMLAHIWNRYNAEIDCIHTMFSFSILWGFNFHVGSTSQQNLAKESIIKTNYS